MSTLFTSESVTIGHPDKVCDYIADSILDAIIEKDPISHVACEVTATGNFLHIMGEISTKAKVDYDKIAREAISKIGYTKPEYGFSDKCEIKIDIHGQSEDIAMGVNQDNGEIGAGDQGIMFGYATDETPSFMPYCIDTAHRLTKNLRKLRENKTISYLRPDGKSQVTVEFDNNGSPKSIKAIVLSTQSDDNIDIEILRNDIKQKLILPSIDNTLIDKNTKFFINPTGRFVLGGPAGDSGLTGRKIVVDTYGGSACHGGGAFAGKDPTKVDRSITCMLRRIAKTIVATGDVKKCEIQAAYSIGIAQPVSLSLRTFGTSKIKESLLLDKIKNFYDLRPKAVIEFLDLQRPIYAQTNDSGAFGNDLFSSPWEIVDRGF